VTGWKLTRHHTEVGMVQLPAHASTPQWALDDLHESPFWSLTRTADELCIICAWEDIPGTTAGVGPFVVFSIDGPLDHSLVGVLAGLLDPLATAGISILAESTFDTDWILIPSAQADQAMEAWQRAGHTIEVEDAA